MNGASGINWDEVEEVQPTGSGINWDEVEESKPKFDLDAQSNVNELPDWQRKRISEDE